ncbi:MAG: hypothetical protein ABIS50_04660 [Luteolibacter sp.]|uniref:hypothetical protein n=1 Tax=Luteolibacter sp. TaxID=1962973 RepID=UPI0032650FDE
MNDYSAQTHPVAEIPKPARPLAVRCVPPVARIFLAGVLFLALSFVAQAGLFDKPNADFTNYEVPLYQQITNHIKVKILARLGEGKNTRDRYFIIPFAYQNKGNDPGYSHSFMTVIRVLADNKQPKLIAGIKTRTYKDREFQAFTISWLPADFSANPNLCVFKGFGARIFPTWNQCPMVTGRSFTLEETIKLAVNVKNAVCMWGPYEISKDGFDLAVKRLRLLEGGTLKYRADDRLTRENHTAINCFHAMAGLTNLFPKGGIFGTGFNMWGINGTSRVLLEYNETAHIKGVLLEPVDDKKDRFGFVYAPTREGKYYDPFKTASAYQR